uniref:Reverse transcriptase-rnase h-integrase n=1 Tax=Moniliophthora roreri TaxID=221103 RepID=A0A0W0G0B7_MONRR
MASPFFFIAKKEKGALRPMQDYRELNKGTVKNTYPLPLISELLNKLKGATIFTKLNLRNGYNNVRIKDGDQWKATFKTNRGLFKPTVMFFGLSNSPATFQAFMNNILSDFINEGWCVVYMDDILIFSKDQNEHKEHMERLMRCLKKHDLFLKPEKCEFDVTEVVFLGMVIRPGYIAMDPIKLAGIADWEPLQTVKGVAFNLLKTKFLSEPILVMPDVDKPFVIEANASKWATGAVLRQKGTDGEWHPCGYLSKSLSPTERNYEIYDRELLAIYRALMEWHHYLMGGKFKIVVLSDHKNLTYFRTAQKLNRRQARWSLFLSEFDLGLVHVPGNDNEDIVVLPDRLFIRGIDLGMKEDIAEQLGPDDFHKSALEQLLEQGMPPIKSVLSDWKIEGDLLFFQGRVYMPNNTNLRRRIVQSIHETPGVGHPGQWNTIKQVQRDFWWPGMAKFIRSFVDGCIICQQSKINMHPTRTPIQPIQATPNSFPFQVCTMDLITDLPECDGMDSILVVVDHSSMKGVIFTPCAKTTDTTKIAEILIQHLYKRFGLLDHIISNRDPRFAAEVFQEMGKQLSIKHSMSMAFHLQTDGETERVNQEVEVYLRAFCSKEQTQWKEYLPLAEFAHNNRTHSVLKKSPFFMMMGYHPRLLPTVFKKTTIPSVEERLQELKRMIQREKQKLDVFEEGQKVWLEAKNLAMGYPSKKLAPKREGPFKVLKVLGPVMYKLDLPHQWKIHPVFHAALLSPFKQTKAHGPSFTEPPPDLIEGFKEYEVEAVVGHRPKKRPREFLVSYTSYDSSHNRWIQMEGMVNCLDLLKRLIMSNTTSSPSSTQNSDLKLINAQAACTLNSISDSPPPYHSTEPTHIPLLHRLNEDRLCFANPIPVHAIPISSLYNFPYPTTPTTIDNWFEIWTPPTIKEDVDDAIESPELCEAPCCYTPKTLNRRPVGVIRCYHPDIVGEYIEYYVCTRCFGLKHRFCGMDIIERRRIEQPWPKNNEETEWKVVDQATKPWGPCWDENPLEKNWWTDAAEWAKWNEENGLTQKSGTLTE